jgi:RNA polymerase sigma-70 factor (ECF subfamily)
MPAEAPSLENLVQASAEGQAAAQRALYERLYPYGMSIALHYAGQREEAEEITQDSFVKLFRHLLRQQPEGAIKPYFSRIVINTAIDLLRKLKRREMPKDLSHSLVATSTSRNKGADRIQEEEIFRLLQMLPISYRLVFNLHVLEGFSHPEIGKKLGISEGTSKSNLFKARRKLKALAAAYYQINQPTLPK